LQVPSSYAPRMKSKRPGNPTWGKAQPLSLTAMPTSFDQFVKSLGLSPHEYIDSRPLKEWVQKNRNSKFVPVELLQTWGISVKSEV
jgi:hypothetical protein